MPVVSSAVGSVVINIGTVIPVPPPYDPSDVLSAMFDASRTVLSYRERLCSRQTRLS